MQPTSQEKQPELRSTKLVLENLGVAKLGKKTEPTVPFKGAAVAKVIRSNHDVDHVAVRWDDARERPYVVFDPNTSRGLIMEFVFFYTYDWPELEKANSRLTEQSLKVGVKPVEGMELSEVNLELLYVHGVEETLLNQYQNIHSRRALLAQKRNEHDEKTQKPS